MGKSHEKDVETRLIKTAHIQIPETEVIQKIYRFWNLNGGYGWTRTTDLSIMSAAL